ncbi:MAG TPA: SMP-30/gluconolactonase/LRE family protein [Humisphaera sp.]
MNRLTSAGRLGAALAAILLLGWTSPSRAATEGFDVRDAGEFGKCVDPASAKLRKLAGGLKFVEGPVWVPSAAAAAGEAGGVLVFSDIPGNALMKYDPAEPDEKKRLSTYRTPSEYTNGNAIDAEGRLIHACHGLRCVQRSGKDGKVETLVETVDGKRFNSPNDVVVAKDGAIYFTDPPYGVPKGQQRELDYHGVFRFDPAAKKLTVLAKDVQFPNGIALSPDGKTLYVARSDPKEPVIRAYDLKPDGTLGDGKDLCRIEKGGPDGIRVDADGRIWSSGGDGVSVFSPAGKLLGKILVPEVPANLAFGGKDGRTLFVTARTGLYAIDVKVGGVK